MTAVVANMDNAKAAALNGATLLVAEIGAAHGVKGLVKLKSYTDPLENVFGYKPLHDDAGKTHKVTMIRPMKDGFLCRLDDVDNRSLAEKLKGMRLFIDRTQLPSLSESEDDYYLVDLIGLKVRDGKEDVIGTISEVVNYGAGDLLLVVPVDADASAWYCPFSKAAVPVVDIKQGWLAVNDELIAAFRFEAALSSKAKVMKEGVQS